MMPGTPGQINPQNVDGQASVLPHWMGAGRKVVRRWTGTNLLTPIRCFIATG